MAPAYGWRAGEPADTDDDPFERAARIQAPSLVVVGALDLDATADAALQWAAALPDDAGVLGWLPW